MKYIMTVIGGLMFSFISASEKQLLPTCESYSDKAWNLLDKSFINPGKNLKDLRNPAYYTNTIEELQKKPNERKNNQQFISSFTAMANRSSEAIKFLCICMDNNKTDEVIEVLKLNELILPDYMIEAAKHYLHEKKQDIGAIVDNK